MTEEFRILFDWLPATQGEALERVTSAELEIQINGRAATEVDDLFARTVRPRVRASAYPLALWFGANWWRLRWEPTSSGASWKMSHKVGAAGGGYVWPDLTFCSDGDTVLIRCRPTGPSHIQPVRYLADFDAVVAAPTFERAVDEFVQAVLDRLDAHNLSDSDLAKLWSELQAERQEAESTVWRRLEALSGFDPDEAPDGFIEALRGAGRTDGIRAIEELAAATKAEAVRHLSVLPEIRAAATPIRLPSTLELGEPYGPGGTFQRPPWEVGVLAAQRARRAWSLAAGPLSDGALCDLFGAPGDLLAGDESAWEINISAGFRGDRPDGEVGVFLHRRWRAGRRFSLARLVADHLLADASDRVLPVTDARTARQKFQRAFAQEFLCPFEELRTFFGTVEPADEVIEEAAEHFQVSPLLIKTTLVSRGLLTRDTLPDLIGV